MATGSVTKRKAAISLNTPIFFSPFLSHDPPPFPNYKARCIYHWVNTNKTSHRLTHTQTHTQHTRQPYRLLIAWIGQLNRTDTTNIHTCNKACRCTHMHTDLMGLKQWSECESFTHTHLFKCADWRWLPSHTVWLQTVLFYFVLTRAVTKYQVWWSWTLN